MNIKFVKEDITKMNVDAIVNAANSSLLGGGGVDGAIHKVAGPELLDECIGLNGCATGDAKITNGYKLPAKYVIHTVGPIYRDGLHREKELLENCYKKSLKIALDKNLKSIAFPLISSGIYGYPKEDAIDVAYNTIKEFIKNNDYDMDVYIVIFDKEAEMIIKNKKYTEDL